MSVSTAYSQDISIGDVTAADGTTITVPLIINNAPNYVDVFALNVSFCSDNLTFTGCDFTGSLVDNFFTRNCDFIDVVGDTQDQILISGYEDDIGAGLDQGTSGTLVNLTFEANCTPGETCDFILSDLLNHFSGWTPGNGSFQCACVPSGPEVCDGVDNDCDPNTPDGADETWLGDPCDGADSDLCNEGAFQCVAGAMTCSDNTGDTLEICDGVDNDCNPATADGADETWLGSACDSDADTDLCEDDTYQCTSGTQTCSDINGSILDLCDGADNDCNPATADGADETWLGDPCDGADSDLCNEGTFQCVGSAMSCTDNTDDTLEICNGQDDDCDGKTDEDASGNPLTQACGSDVGECVSGTQTCASGAWGICEGEVGPAVESPEAGTCADGKDNDCDGLTDDNDSDCLCDPGSQRDCDSGLPGVCADGSQTCNQTGHWDTCVANINPGEQADVCDGLDNDCDGTPDEDFPTLNNPCDGADTDLCEEGTVVCNQDKTGVECSDDPNENDLDLCNGQDDDCNPATEDGADETWLGSACDSDDTDLCEDDSYQCVSGTQTCSDINGSILDLCDGADNDCNPATDDGADEEWLNDPCDGADSDLCNEGIFQCTAGAQSCTDNTDDTVELCNGLDDDCNGLVPVDEFDADGDGVRGCAGDCNDADAAVNPDASEVCDGLDNNCNDQIDEGEGVKNTYYSDSDRDSYGNPDTPTEACHPSVGMVSDNTDCDDTNIAVYPGAPEVCGDEVVNDCNSEAGSEEAAGCDFSGTCTDGETRACNTGGLGICAAGTQGCIDGVWDECLADNQLVDEICNNRLDDNCDGLVDNCNTEFKTFVDLSINPILVCFQANQTLDGDPVVNLIKGNGLVSGLYNPCPNSSLPVYCAYFTPGSGGLDIVPPDGLGDVVVSIEEGTPVGSVPGSAYARFQLETEFESTSSFCLSQTSSGEFIDFLHQAGCDSEEDLTEAYAEVSFEKASLLGLQDDCSADQSAITEVDRSFFAGVIGNTLVTSVVDVSLPDGVTLDGGVVTITLSFELPAGWTRQEFKDNLKIKHSSDGGLTWTSADISNVVVHWDTMTITFDTASLSMFAGSSKQSAASNTSADDTELKGRGCSVIDQKMPTGNAVANTLVFLLPLIVFGIRRKRGKKIK